jgi:hypothetical protein
MSFTTTTVANLNISSTVPTGKYSSIAASGDSVLQAPTGNLILTSNTGSLIVTTGTVDSAKLTINNSGQLINNFPVHLTLYGTPTYYNSAGTSQGTVFSTTNAYYYMLPPTTSTSSTNWTPSITSGSKLAIPYNGLYMLSVSFNGLNSSAVECYITKNLCNNGDLNSNDDRLLCTSMTTGVGELNLATTANLITTDYINFGFYLSTGSIVAGARTSVRISLIQRTS